MSSNMHTNYIYLPRKWVVCLFKACKEREENEKKKRRVIEYKSERERDMPSGRERGATAVFGVVFLKRINAAPIPEPRLIYL